MVKDDLRRGASLLSIAGGGLAVILFGLGVAVWAMGPDLEDGQRPKNFVVYPNQEPVAMSAGMGGGSGGGQGASGDRPRGGMGVVTLPSPPQPPRPAGAEARSPAALPAEKSPPEKSPAEKKPDSSEKPAGEKKADSP